MITWNLYCDECGEEIDSGRENTLDEMKIIMKTILKKYERESDGKCPCDRCKKHAQEERPFQLYNY